MYEEQKGKQRCQQLTALAATIRQITLFKNTSTFTLSDLINQVADTTRGTFMSTRKFYICKLISIGEREELILELARVVPKWLVIKTLGNKGRIVKCFNQAVNAFDVNKIIKAALDQD